MTKRIDLASSCFCSFCHEPMRIHEKAWLEDDCRVECNACHAEAERVAKVREQLKASGQRDLFGGKE